MHPKIKVKIKLNHYNADIPEYATGGSSGFDLRALKDTIVSAGNTVLVNTGLSFEFPEGYELQVRPRSGMSLKSKLRIANAPGTVDKDFSGSVGIIIDNIGEDDYYIKAGDKIAQGVIVPVLQASFVEVDQLTETERGSGGYGSTGI